MTEEEIVTTAVRLVAAIFAGGLIGLERSINGRPAGFRTHSLVCMASSLLMLLTVFQWELLKDAPIETIRVDPTRMAQGIMTGIGFLGAGVIMKERFTVRGLTTAASIWMTASLGILIGMGFYWAGVLATILALGTLSTFRILERNIPHLHFGNLSIKVLRKSNLEESELLEIVEYYGIKYSNRSYYLRDEGKAKRYEMGIRTRDPAMFKNLAETLSQVEEILEFSISPVSK